MKLWQGRFTKELNEQVSDFNASLPFDCRMWQEDIKGSIAHVTMLGECGILPKSESEIIAKELEKLLSEDLHFENAEDIHSFIEIELTKRLGDLGKKLHTARSRNDQVATDLRLYLRKEIDEIIELVSAFIEILEKKKPDDIMPGYTHLQRAQPITFAMHIGAYCEMFARDVSRLEDCKKRLNECPLGAGALAGVTYNIDRELTAKSLGFTAPMANTLDAVADRDYCVELAADISLIAVHLSRFAEEIILWASSEFKFIELDDAFATGSSIMPQKKNPDIAELVRGKAGRIFGNNMALLTMLKALPLAYNKDMQEDKEAIFDSVDTIKSCILAFSGMVETMKILPLNMRNACNQGFINATDVADYLTKKGVPFRDAYKITGEIVAYCIENGLTLETLTDYKQFSSHFDDDVYQEISLENCISKRKNFS